MATQINNEPTNADSTYVRKDGFLKGVLVLTMRLFML